MGMSLATTYEDKEIFYPDGSPVNNYSRTYSDSWMTIRQAIRSSINTVAVQCLEDVTPELGLKYLDNFGFTTLAHGEADENGNIYTDANLSTALGGITSGVTNVELCAAYASIANKGNYIKPIYYTQILDHNGNVLIDNTSATYSLITLPQSALLLKKAQHGFLQTLWKMSFRMALVEPASLTICRLQAKQVQQTITMISGL